MLSNLRCNHPARSLYRWLIDTLERTPVDVRPRLQHTKAHTTSQSLPAQMNRMADCDLVLCHTSLDLLDRQIKVHGKKHHLVKARSRVEAVSVNNAPLYMHDTQIVVPPTRPLNIVKKTIKSCTSPAQLVTPKSLYPLSSSAEAAFPPMNPLNTRVESTKVNEDASVQMEQGRVYIC